MSVIKVNAGVLNMAFPTRKHRFFWIIISIYLVGLTVL